MACELDRAVNKRIMKGYGGWVRCADLHSDGLNSQTINSHMPMNDGHNVLLAQPDKGASTKE